MQVTTTINETKELIKKWKKCKPEPEMPGGK